MGSSWRAILQPVVVMGLVIGTHLVAAEPVDFTYDVRPVLATKCFSCHGPDEAHRKADLRLDTRDGLFAASRDFGDIVVAGAPDESVIIDRITSTDPDEVMPPPDSGEPLTAEEQDAVRRWISEGAEWDDHWSYVPPTRPSLPEVQNAQWPKMDFDHFVLARLEEEGLAPSPRADKATLIRRLSLDLTGLPPTWEEVEAFLNDDSEDAYATVVERLLASPRYGERWARVWLDLARYSDTRGYEKDRARTIWRYRDYVIDAFNRDLPYDQFTTEQLAGDLLPNATLDQRLATAFHRNTMTNDEGGTDNEEFRVYAVRDRVDTTMQVWMGLTMGCAKCHTHKYDPISIDEYYSFFAYFNQTADADTSSDAPLLAAPTAEQTATINGFKGRISAFEDVMNALKQSTVIEESLAKWEANLSTIPSWAPLTPTEVTSENGTTLTVRDDGSVLASGELPDTDTYITTMSAPLERLALIRLEVLRDDSLPGKGPGRQEKGNFHLTRFTASLRHGEEIRPIEIKAVTFSHHEEGRDANAIIAGESKADGGWAIAPQYRKNHHADLVLAQPIDLKPGDQIEIRLEQHSSDPQHLIGAFRFSATSDLRTPQRDAIPADIQQIAAKNQDDRSDEERRALITYHATTHAEVTLPVRQEIASLNESIGAIAIPQIPVMAELPEKKQRKTHVMQRGDFLSPGDEVAPSVPAHFHAFPDDAPANRLGIAQWLMDPSNPLTARVAVNRHWAQFFGRGIVETEEDFGAQGMLPTHPEVLDWLAVEFREQGWSFKQLCRTIVMSATYQQASTITPVLKDRDPDNRLLARGPGFRLDAEAIRDNALAVAGLLSDKMFGPSVMPPQPDGIWRSTYNVTQWVTSAGEDRYRRGLYTFHKRTSPYPSMLTFDGTTREWCAIRRFRTNTPLQALVVLNDPVYVEAAQAFARVLLSEEDVSTQARIQHAYRRAVARDPAPYEVEQLTALYERRLAHYAAHADEAEAMSTVPLGPLPPGMRAAEAAAWTNVCNVILNLDEVLTKG